MSTNKNTFEDPFKGPDGFKKFLFYIWHFLNLPAPTPIQYDIGDFLQHGPKRCIIEAFRGVGKSWETSAFVVWLLYCNPQLKIIVVSAAQDRAIQFSTFTKRLINEVPLLQHLRPDPSRGQRDSNLAFDVGPATPDHSPSVKSVGIFGQLTGSRADIIIADDIEVANNSATHLMRNKLSEAVKEFDAILKPKEGSRIIYLGTPQTEESLYSELQTRGYVARVWPAMYPTYEQSIKYGNTLAKIIDDALACGKKQPGQSTEPTRFTEVDLMERMASYGRAGFALQFMLMPELSDVERYPLKLTDLIVANLPHGEAALKYTWGPTPELTLEDLPCMGFKRDRYYRPMSIHASVEEYSGTVMAIDPSGRGQDETSYAVVSHLHGQLFLRSAGGISGGGYDDETLRKLARIAKDNGVKEIIVEANYGDGMFTQLLKPVLMEIYPCTVSEVKHSKQKELRIIDTIEPVMMQHRLIVDRKVIESDHLTSIDDPSKSLFHQMARITKDRGALAHDDRLDALAIAIAYWVEAMARNIEKSIKRASDKALMDDLKKFIKSVQFKNGAKAKSGDLLSRRPKKRWM